VRYASDGRPQRPAPGVGICSDQHPNVGGSNHDAFRAGDCRRRKGSVAHRAVARLRVGESSCAVGDGRIEIGRFGPRCRQLDGEDAATVCVACVTGSMIAPR
jgi:hypothetical protein